MLWPGRVRGGGGGGGRYANLGAHGMSRILPPVLKRYRTSYQSLAAAPPGIDIRPYLPRTRVISYTNDIIIILTYARSRLLISAKVLNTNKCRADLRHQNNLFSDNVSVTTAGSFTLKQSSGSKNLICTNTYTPKLSAVWKSAQKPVRYNTLFSV